MNYSIRRWLLVPMVSCGLLFVIVAAGRSDNREGLEALGLRYRMLELAAPRPNRVHVLRVDLTREQVRPLVVLADDPDGAGPAEAALTDPRTLVAHDSVVAFVNTNPWAGIPELTDPDKRGWYEGQPVEILGLAVSAGQIRSEPHKDYVSVWVDRQCRVRMGCIPDVENVAEGFAGFQQVLREGQVIVAPDGPLHPRTAVGIDACGASLCLVVVDGRQPGFSEGMTLHELASLLLELGCVDAANLDGGGSSIMGLIDADGGLRVVNAPSDPRGGALPSVRPVPAILTIQKKPASRSRVKSVPV